MNGVKDKVMKYGSGPLEGGVQLPMLVLLILLFSIWSPSFLSLTNLKNLIVQNTFFVIVVIGMLFIMSTGGIDFSMNDQISLISIVIGLAFSNELRVPVVLAMGILCGILCGLFNGVLVSFCRINAVVMTLASRFIFNGLTHILSHGISYTAVPSAIRAVARNRVLGLTMDIWLCLLCVCTAVIVFRYTVLGKYIQALGTGRRTMLQAGINVNAISALSYIIGSIFVSIAAIIIVARQGLAAASTGSTDYGILSICAVYIGGASFEPYDKTVQLQRASVLRVLAGCGILAVIKNGIQITGVNQYMEYVIIGCVLIVTELYGRYDLKKGKR